MEYSLEMEYLLLQQYKANRLGTTRRFHPALINRLEMLEDFFNPSFEVILTMNPFKDDPSIAVKLVKFVLLDLKQLDWSSRWRDLRSIQKKEHLAVYYSNQEQNIEMWAQDTVEQLYHRYVDQLEIPKSFIVSRNIYKKRP